MAAIDYNQSFDGLTDGDLNGQDSWTATTGGKCSVGSSAVYKGAKSLYFSAQCSGNRTISSATTGTFYWALRIKTTHTAGDGPYLQFASASYYNAIVKAIMNGSNLELQYYSNGSYVSWQTISTNTWYVVGVDLDQPNNRYRLSLNNGSWSSYVTQGSSGATAMTKFSIGQDPTWQGYFDEMSTTYPTAPSTASPAFLLKMT